MNSIQSFRSRLASSWRTGHTVLLTTVAVAATLIGVRQIGLLQPLELSLFDQMTRLQPDRGPDDRLLVVGVTENDIQTYGYPLNDQTVVQLLKMLEQSEPTAIGLDIIRDVPQEPGRAELLKYFQQTELTLGVCHIHDDTTPGFPPPPGLPDSAIGFANLPIDPGGIVRRAALTIVPPKSTEAAANAAAANAANFCNTSEDALPSLGLLLALQYLDKKGIKPDESASQLKLGDTEFRQIDPDAGGYRHADTGGYQILLDYRSAQNVARQVSLTDVLTGKLDPNWVKQHLVLIGYTARSVKDELQTPYSTGDGQRQPMPGVLIHAQIASQILSSVLDRRPQIWYWSDGIEMLWIVGWAVAGGLLTWRLRHPLGLGVAVVVGVTGLFGLSWALFSQAGWIPLAPAALAFVLAAGGVIVVDRGYAKALYQGVKGFLKLDIAIDIEQKDREVAAITESDYFRQLETKGGKLRQHKTESPVGTGTGPLAPANSEMARPDPDRAPPPAIPTVAPPNLGSDRRPSSAHPDPASWTETRIPPEPLNGSADLDYLQQLQKRGERMKHQRTESAINSARLPKLAPEPPEATIAAGALPTVQPSGQTPTETAIAPESPTGAASQSAFNDLLQAVEDHYQRLKQGSS